MSSAPVLVVEHEPTCPVGWMGEWLLEAGASLDVRRPSAGDSLPSDLAEHAGLLVLGGSMGAYDEATCPWLATVKRLLRRAAEDGAPALGICLGHQLAAVALGGAVARNPRGQQIGVLEVGWLPEAREDRLLGPLVGVTPAVQWNNDLVVELPPDAVPLARTPAGELQAARFAPTVWGVQWHPEAGEQIVRLWAEGDRDQAVERGVDVDSYVADVAAATDPLRRSWSVLAARFAALVPVRP
ncbi:MAG TPA: type 1 glutamine amidotransferase [Nocardioidaceae bacterium]|nr:type 1 glutamine amidotransferase [Nocardioidaceae bacterium]